jgi:hypothetical protein
MIFLTKRRKFIISSLVLSIGLFAIQKEWLPNRYLAISAISLLSIPLVLWSLKEALKGPVWLFSWFLPMLFTAGVGFFYFLLPGSFYTIIPVIILYFLGMYILFLSENIFSVASIRTIQLFRSASAVSFLLSLFVSFLLYDIVYSFRFPFYINMGLIYLISFMIFLHWCWSINLEEKVSKKIVVYSLVFSLGLSQIAGAISFWPMTVVASSILLTSIVYVVLGLSQADLSSRLFSKTIKEYLMIGGAVIIILLSYTTWG